MKAAALLLLCVVAAAVVVRAADVDVEGESQAELDAAHENAVATLEEYAEKAHALRDEIVSTEQSLMEQAAAIDTCPAGELAGLMARAKQQIAHLLQVKALYLAIKQQETQLRALVDAGTGKRAPTVAPKPAARKPVVPAKPKAAAVAKPAVKPASAAAAAKPLDSASFAKLSAMNAKLHNALARLESVTARLAKVEKRQDSSKKATLLIAGQMEKDEKRLNKHSRVLRRVRKGVHGIKSRLSRLEQSLVRGKAAIAVIDKKHGRKHHKHGKHGKHAKKHGKHGRKHRKHRKHAKKHGKHAKKHSKHSKKVSKKHAKGRRHPRRGGRGARKLTPLKKQHKKAFNVAKCYKSCGAKKGKAQKKCLRRCQRKARASGKGKEARPKALRVCLKKCRAASKKGGKKSRGAAKKCALSCFRRHAKKRASKKGGKKNAQLLMCSRACKQIKSLPAKKGKGKRASKAAVKKAKAKCHRDCKQRYGRSGKGKGKKHAKKAKKAKKFDVKKCLKKCPRSKKHPKRASKRCASKCHTKARAKKGLKTAKNPKLKTCFKTCRAGRKWNMSCVKSCRARFGAKAKAHKKAKNANKKLLKQCFKTCKGKAHYVVRGKGKHARKVRVAGKWDMKCVKSCRKRFGKKAKKHSKKPKVSAALKKCYKTCRGPARVVIRGVGKKAHRTTVRGAYNKACVSRCQKKFGKKAKKAHAPPTAAYKACLARCRPGKAFKKCKKACKKHNKSRKIKVVSPSAKLVKDALKSLKKPKKVKRHSRPETWDDVVRDSRRLLKKTVRLRHLIHKQTARYQDKKDVEGRKYNGWWSIWDVLKGVKPGKHYTGRAKQIAADVKQIMAPRLAKAADGPYGEIVNVLAGADTAFGSKYTRELGSPSLDLTVDPKFDGYVEKPLPGAKIRHVPYNPKKPYDSNKLYKRSPPLSRLPEIVEEDYNSNLKPMYVKDFHVVPRKAARPSQPFNLKTKNWDYPQIPYSYPVTMVKHDPKANNPHVHAPKPGFHREWPEFSHIETAAGAGAAAAVPAPVQAQAQAPMTAPAPAAAQEAPMTEGTAF